MLLLLLQLQQHGSEEGWGGRERDALGLTEPRKLITLHLDGQAEIGQLHSGSTRLARQQQVLGLLEQKK